MARLRDPGRDRSLIDGDQHQGSGTDRAYDLGHDVPERFDRRQALVERYRDGDGGVVVPTGDMSEREDGGEQAEAEGEGDHEDRRRRRAADADGDAPLMPMAATDE